MSFGLSEKTILVPLIGPRNGASKVLLRFPQRRENYLSQIHFKCVERIASVSGSPVDEIATNEVLLLISTKRPEQIAVTGKPVSL